MNEKITRGFLLRICMWTGWSQILTEDWWVTRSIVDFAEDLHMNKLTADLNWRYMSNKINRGFSLKICVWAGWLQVDRRFKFKIYKWQDQSRILVEDLHMNRLNKISIDQEAVAQIWLLWCKSCSGCPKVDLSWIRATEKSRRRLTVHRISWYKERTSGQNDD